MSKPRPRTTPMKKPELTKFETKLLALLERSTLALESLAHHFGYVEGPPPMQPPPSDIWHVT